MEHLKHYNQSHHEALEKAREYSELKDIALDIMSSMPKPIGQVCGPISTGGLGSIDKNMMMFEKTIIKLVSQGNVIFNQLPFEKSMWNIRSNSKKSIEESNQSLLEEFYLPLFKSGHVKRLYFIYGWESSHGSKWERKRAAELGLEIIDLPMDFLDD
jgi:hypothetical protein